MKTKILLMLLLVSVSCMAKEYYVDAGTAGKQQGTPSAPFRTIQQAADVMKAGDVCLIRTGVYPESVRPANSGTEGNPVVFKTEKGADVVVTGTDPISGDAWEKVDGKRFRTKIDMTLGHENQVFLRKQMMLVARWPNAGNDPLMPTLAKMDAGTTPERIVDADLPGVDWTSARIWIHAPKYWTDWTTSTMDFKKGSFGIDDIAPYPGPRRHVAAEGADYFLYGTLSALDTINEWFYDKKEGYLYVFRPDGRLPDEPYYTKQRMNAFDLKGRSFVKLDGLQIYGSTIATDRESRHIVMDGLKVFYSYHSSEVNSQYGQQNDKGVLMLGSNCLIQNCEIAYSSASGILLDGHYNMVLNCFIHDTDYCGSMAACVKLQGKGNIISHCTLCRTGRSVIDYGSMYKSLIQYCDMYHSGMLTSDTGLTYGNVIEGGHTEVRYNWLHDNLDTHMDMGLYYDHGTQNILSHHNLVWGPSYGFLINFYAYYHLAYNNTFSARKNGFRSAWGNQYLPDLHGCRFFNNIFGANCKTTAGNYAWGHNIQNYKELVDHRFLPENSPAIDAGIVIPGITDGFTGSAPDLGAYESGGPDWKVGHDFDNPPELVDTVKIRPLHMNRLENSAFEHEDNLSPWKASGRFEIIHGGKAQNTPDTMKYRMGDASISLGEDGEIAQLVTGLDPGTWYEFAGFLRVDAGVQAVLGVRNAAGREEHSSAMEGNSPGWNRVLLEFKTGPDQTSATVFAKRINRSEGEVYADDCGLIFVRKE